MLDHGEIKEYDDPKVLILNPNSLFSEVVRMMNEAGA